MWFIWPGLMDLYNRKIMVWRVGCGMMKERCVRALDVTTTLFRQKIDSV